VLRDPGAVAERAHHRRGALTVQADFTVLAPPETAPDVVARLERWADLESDAGVRVYRLAESRIAHALTLGETAEDVAAFLDEHSGVDVPQNVRYLLHDVARTHGQVRAGTATAYVRCDDPALLARAAGYRTARLRVLAPTVAVSSLSRDKLVETLRAKGLALVAEDDDGATVTGGGEPGRPRLGGPDTLPEPVAIVPAPQVTADLAARLFTTAGAEVVVDAVGRWTTRGGAP
jgi:hypothetical protein